MKRYMIGRGSASFIAQPSELPPDAGAGTGGSPGAASSGSPAGSGDGSGGASGSSSAPIKLTSDTLVDLGDGQPAKWGELTAGEKARFMPRENYDRGVNYLTTEAQRLQRQWEQQQQQQQRQHTPQRQAPKDPFQSFRGRPMVDGDSIAQMGERMYQEGFHPMAQAFAAIAAKVKDLENQLGETRQTLAPHQESRARQEFESIVARAVDKLDTVKGLPEGGKIDASDPFIKELAEDVHSSYEPGSWKPGEFEKVLKSRVEGMIAFVRKLDQDALKNAEEIRRRGFFPPVNRGSGRGSGEPQYKHENGASIAARAREAGLFRRSA